ncbi:MAG: hypothetical protein WDZ68_01505 [Candidatus Paceibacterota bacterium]
MSDTYKTLVAQMNKKANRGEYDCPDAIVKLQKRADAGDLDARAMLNMLGHLNAQFPKQKV